MDVACVEITEAAVEPIVYTIKGNLPISQLEYFFWWEDEENYMKFVQGYKLNGEVVKQEAHVYMKKGQDLGVALEENS